MDAGADGFLLKRATPEQLIDGIRTVFAGDALVAPAVTRRLLQAYAGRRPADREKVNPAAHLTERETDSCGRWPTACPMPRSPPRSVPTNPVR